MGSVPVNWIAVLVSAVVAFGIGGIWFAPPLFGKVSAKVLGKKPSPSNFALEFATMLAAAAVVAVILGWAGASTLANGVLVGVVGWIGFAGFNSISRIGYEVERWQYTAVTSAYQLIQFAIMGAVLGAWH